MIERTHGVAGGAGGVRLAVVARVDDGGGKSFGETRDVGGSGGGACDAGVVVALEASFV